MHELAERRFARRVQAHFCRAWMAVATAIASSTIVFPLIIDASAQPTDPGPPYPRIANLYLHGAVNPEHYSRLSKYDVLILDSIWMNSELQRLRVENPDIKLFFYVCAQSMGVDPLPRDQWRYFNWRYAQQNDMFWRNVDGSIASDWPGTALINMTDRCSEGPQGSWRSYLARRIEHLMAARPVLNGVFLDNFWRAIAWQQGKLIEVDSDCNPTLNPAGCDGVADPPAELDSLWNQALRDFARDVRSHFDRLETSPGSGTPLAILTNGASDYFPWVNGTMHERFPSRNTPADPGNPYGYNWHHEMTDGEAGYLTAQFSSRPYNVQIMNAMWDGTVDAPTPSPEFERHKRFTLCSTLLGDGYYSLDAEPGHGSVWWEPEYDGGGIGKGYLGYPVGPARRVATPLGVEQLTNGSFSSTQLPWRSQGDRCFGVFSLDNRILRSSPGSARLDVTNLTPGGGFKLYQNVPVFGGTAYTLRFWARASVPQEMLVQLYSTACIDDRCMTDQRVQLSTIWQFFEVSFVSTGHAQAGLNMFVNTEGSVWIDDVSLRPGDRNIYIREFDRGVVLLNYTTSTQRIPLDGTYYRLRVPGSPVWDGAPVNIETVPPSDGRILMRTPRPTDSEPPQNEGRRHGILLHNEPNPFRPSTDISFALERDEPVRLAVYDVAGRRVRMLVDRPLTAGREHVVRWDATDDAGNHVPPGVYFYKLETPSGVHSRKTIRLGD
jgi:hypothetical protein